MKRGAFMFARARVSMWERPPCRDRETCAARAGRDTEVAPTLRLSNLGAVLARFAGSHWVRCHLIWMTCCILSWSASVQAQELFSSRHDPIPSEIEACYLKGLKYLVSSQTTSGNWNDGYGNQPGVVGLAVLAMLAHGDDPSFGPYSAAIQRGIGYILDKANSANGYLGQSMYNHGFATLALAEAYGAIPDPRIGPALQRAVGLILSSQKRNPNHAWRYSPESDDADTTVSGCQLVALFAARNAGMAVPDEAIKQAIGFFLHCQTPDGGIGYSAPGGPNNTRTAIGLLVMSLNKQKETPAFRSALGYLASSASRNDSYPFYHEYYASQALFQADEEEWNGWNQRNAKYMTSAQKSDGSWEGNNGTTFSTSAALLSLALNYRFLPIYER